MRPHTTVVNKKSATDTAPKTTRYSYTSRGERFSETKANGNTVTYDYFLSGVLRHSLEKKPNATVVSEHTIGYQGNLHRSSDHAKIQNADNPGAYLDHTYAYTYDPRDRIAKTVKTPTSGGTAETETYSHDANSNVWEEEVLGKKTTFTYDRNRLMTSVTNGATSTYTYDPYGRLRTIQGGGKTLEKYTHDGFDHVTKHEKLGGDGVTSTVTSYTYDPLDRTTSKTEKEGTANAKTTTYSYLGLSAEVLDEEVAGKLTKSFQYSPWGERLSQVKVNADSTEESSYYGYNPHADVEQITSETGDTRATYGYTAYGKNDDKLFTGVDKPDPVDPTAKEEYNPYRFNAKRWDNSTGMYDMGFRDYNPGLNRFLNLDTYNGALSDLSLGLDPWTANRYAFTGGNPISNVELDGHEPRPWHNPKFEPEKFDYARYHACEKSPGSCGNTGTQPKASSQPEGDNWWSGWMTGLFYTTYPFSGFVNDPCGRDVTQCDAKYEADRTTASYREGLSWWDWASLSCDEGMSCGVAFPTFNFRFRDKSCALCQPSLGTSVPTRGPARVGTSTSDDYRSTFFKATGLKEDDYVVHHAIEQQILDRYPGLFTKSEIHSLENLRGSVNSEVHLSMIRKLWNNFYDTNSNPTRQQVLNYATKIDDMLGHWFAPRVR
ncbi:hypothetical protein OHA25_54115 [Nonomuraea sp. NBC_00507]|uniref:RHS repeat domain-containing protein n=1 Tax=Nonomuraea sp. NBC_00507 TaxID=2976002 RepID=UPI002E176818